MKVWTESRIYPNEDTWSSCPNSIVLRWMHSISAEMIYTSSWLDESHEHITRPIKVTPISYQITVVIAVTVRSMGHQTESYRSSLVGRYLCCSKKPSSINVRPIKNEAWMVIISAPAGWLVESQGFLGRSVKLIRWFCHIFLADFFSFYSTASRFLFATLLFVGPPRLLVGFYFYLF